MGLGLVVKLGAGEARASPPGGSCPDLGPGMVESRGLSTWGFAETTQIDRGCVLL